MRNFRDARGREWEATTGRESWGGHVLLFSSRGEHEIRTAPLAAETALDAQRVLAELSEDELRDRLAASQPWG